VGPIAEAYVSSQIVSVLLPQDIINLFLYILRLLGNNRN
jgi:FtsH-binding integral membrane protein